MRRLEYKNDYIKMPSNKGFALFAGFKLNRYLVISTFFNPFNFEDFYNDIAKIYGVNYLEAINKYDDGTGYLIFLIDHTFDQRNILGAVEKVFAKHFFNEHRHE